MSQRTDPDAGSAIDRWRADLAEWAIPQEIVDAAPESPWAFTPRLFADRADRALSSGTPTPSNTRGLEALPSGGSVLDIGCGGGAASLPLLGRARRLVALDQSDEMLEQVRLRVPEGVELTLVRGVWPEAADRVPEVDVVVCNHVVYNVSNLDEAVMSMTRTARRRVVLECTREHPRSPLSFLWPLFHGIGRPARPTALDAVEVIRACGLDPQWEGWAATDLHLESSDEADVVAAARRYLCVGPDRDPEIAAALRPRLVRRDGRLGLPPHRVVTIWWDA